MPPVIVNVPPTEGLPGWVAPVVGFVGVLVGLVGNNLLTRAREQRHYHRDMKFALYLELQNSEYEVRRWLPLREPVKPDWLERNARWASLQLRMGLFASPKVEELGNKFWDGLHEWLVEAESESTEDSGPENDKRKELFTSGRDLLKLHTQLHKEIRKDLKISPRSS